MRSRPAPSAPKAPISELALREFVRAWGLFYETMRPYFARFGISDAQWGVLRTLQRAEDANQSPLRLTDLGERLLVRPPSVTGVVDRLERDGLVLRRPSPDDNRAKRVVLTSRGRALVRRVVRHHPAQIRRILSGLENGDVREMHRVMTRFAEHLQELGARDSTGRRGAR
jgi:DNA-binding MarR family transcriptional regulator